MPVRRGAGMTDGVAWPLVGHGGCEARFAEARAGGRLHHAWLVEGPSGIGKARLARRMAAAVLGAGCEAGTLDAPPDDPVVRKIAAGSHPDLRWVARVPDEKGKLPQDIPVEAIRDLNGFFALKPALGGWRVGVVDALDELNLSGANALLKTLEEPGRNSLLILVSHGSVPVLPTIRSRCRVLRAGRLDPDETREVLGTISGTGSADAAALGLANGRPGFGAALAGSSGLAALNAARVFLRALPAPADAALADLLARGSADDAAFEAMATEFLAWISVKADGDPALARAWLDCSRLLAEARALNMDRGQAAAKLVSALQNAIKAR